MDNISSYLFVDTETVPAVEFEKLDLKTIELYERKFKYELQQEGAMTLAEHYQAKASLYAEFSRIACISVGYLTAITETTFSIRMKTFISRDEKFILNNFSATLAKMKNVSVVAHNGKEFDFPYIGRRFTINRIPVPTVLNVVGKKPWEINWLDTMDMWKFCQYRYSCSLDLLCHSLGIESPKNKITGADVAGLFNLTQITTQPNTELLPFDVETINFKEISDYCEGDVKACAQCFLAMNGMDSNIIVK